MVPKDLAQDCMQDMSGGMVPGNGQTSVLIHGQGDGLLWGDASLQDLSFVDNDIIRILDRI